MNIIIKTKNLELADSLKALIYKKMAGLKKFITILKDGASEVILEVERETRHHKKGIIFIAEAIIQWPGKKLVAKSKGDSLAKAIAQVKKDLEKEIKNYKTKMIELPRRKYRQTKNHF